VLSGRPSWGVTAAGIILVGAFLYQIDGYALLDPDEGRNAEVAREMAATGNFVLPHLNGIPYLDKPLVFFAVAGAFMKAFGPTVLAARLAPLLFTALALAVLAYLARRLWGAGSAGTTVVAAASTPFVLAYARTVIFDSAVMLWVLLALLGFYLAIEARLLVRRGHGMVSDLRREAAGWRWCVTAWGAIGLGLLTKGPVVLVFPLLIVVPYAIWRRAVMALIPPAGPLFAVAIVLPWVLAVADAVPGFVEYVVVTETVDRLTTDALGRTGPWWYFLIIFPAAALPWTAVLVGALWQERRSIAAKIDHRVIFLALWLLMPLIFFSLSQSKRPQYVLPMVPAVALAIAGLWHRDSRFVGVRAAAVVLAILGSTLVLLRGAIAGWIPAAQADVAGAIPLTATLLGVVCIGAGITAWIGARRSPVAILALSLPIASIPVVSLDLMHAIGEDRSARGLAEAIGGAEDARADVIGIAAFPPSLPFYLRRGITIATEDGAELTSNYVTAHLAHFRGRLGTTLREAGWWRTALLECREGTVFVARASDRAATARLQARLPLLVMTRKYAAYGPCRSGPAPGVLGSR
jgi:4-amino-4-deoxy-L-arabinose transferase-like glycosyltransferase